jgi:hypothetical protein
MKICFEFLFDQGSSNLFILTRFVKFGFLSNAISIGILNFSIPGYCCARQYARLEIALLSNIAQKYC